MNPWEAHALEYKFPDAAPGSTDTANGVSGQRTGQDPVIYPGLYAPSGFDIMSILVQVVSRPNPQIELGVIDCSVALIICDLELPDSPIVYASEAFSELTGYTHSEVLGRNCRFLQTPHGKTAKAAGSSLKGADKTAIRCISRALAHGEEVQVRLTNYKKSGRRFTNALSIVPLTLGQGRRHAIGFQAEG